jgi:hypothetical protein
MSANRDRGRISPKWTLSLAALLLLSTHALSAQTGSTFPKTSARDSRLLATAPADLASRLAWISEANPATPKSDTVITIRCPLIVFAPDSTKKARMPIARADSTRTERIPTSKSTCTNPLWERKKQ